MGPEGLRSNDPGIVRLAAVAGVLPPAADVLLACCGDVPVVGDAATRLCSDVREQLGARHACVFERSPIAPDPLGSRTFALALAWPRPHLGKDFTHLTFARAGMHLKSGGRLLVAARKQKGAKTLMRDAQRLFGAATVLDRSGGIRVFELVRSDAFDDALAREWTGTRYVIEDPLLGDISLQSAAGVFSRRALDRGTATLMQIAPHLLPEHGEPERVIDLGAGIGPLTVWASRRWPSTRVTAVEPNTIASALLRENVKRAGVGERVEVLERANLPRADETPAVDLVLSNPPTHTDREGLARLVESLPGVLTTRGRALFVVSRPEGLVAVLRARGATTAVVEGERHSVVHATFAAP